MKGFAGGRLFDEKRSPFGVSLTPVQCIHYALTRPAVCSILCGYDTKEQVDQALSPTKPHPRRKKITLPSSANAPLPFLPRANAPTAATASPASSNLDIAMINKFYDLATMQPEVPATDAVPLRAAGAQSVRMHRLPGLRKTLPLRRAYCGEDGENGEIVWMLKKKTDSASAESVF